MTPVLCLDCLRDGSAALLAAQLSEHPERLVRPRLRIGAVVAHAARIAGLSVEDLTGKRRFRVLARVRQAIVYVLTRERRHSYPEIGAALGAFDHSTILHNRRVAEALVERDPDFAQLCDDLADAIAGEPWGPRRSGPLALAALPWASDKARKVGLVASPAEAGPAVTTAHSHRNQRGNEYTARHALPPVLAVVDPALLDPLPTERDERYWHRRAMRAGSERLLAAIARQYPERIAA